MRPAAGAQVAGPGRASGSSMPPASAASPRPLARRPSATPATTTAGCSRAKRSTGSWRSAIRCLPPCRPQAQPAHRTAAAGRHQPGPPHQHRLHRCRPLRLCGPPAGQRPSLPGRWRGGLGVDRGAAGARLERLDSLSAARFFLHQPADSSCIGAPTFSALGSRYFLHQAAERGASHGLQRGHCLPPPYR